MASVSKIEGAARNVERFMGNQTRRGRTLCTNLMGVGNYFDATETTFAGTHGQPNQSISARVNSIDSATKVDGSYGNSPNSMSRL